MAKDYKGGQEAAERFLDALEEKDGALRREIGSAVEEVRSVAARHNFEFTHDDLNAALAKKWGPPRNREHCDQGEFFTTLSEAPGF